MPIAWPLIVVPKGLGRYNAMLAMSCRETMNDSHSAMVAGVGPHVGMVACGEGRLIVSGARAPPSSAGGLRLPCGPPWSPKWGRKGPRTLSALRDTACFGYDIGPSPAAAGPHPPR